MSDAIAQPQTQDDDTYFKDWYGKNKGDLNASRKKRYREDPAYRQRVQDSNRASYARNKGEGGMSRRGRKPGPIPPREVTLPDGSRIVLFSSGVLANILGRTPQTVRSWIQSGKLLDTPYRSSNGNRLWTKGQLMAVEEAASEETEESGQIMWKGSKFTERVRAKFAALALPTDPIIV